jgi:hypothetical protein
MLDRSTGTGPVRQDDLRRVPAHWPRSIAPRTPLAVDAGARRAAIVCNGRWRARLRIFWKVTI